MNQFNGIGRLTRDPEIRVTQSGKKIARYALAIERPSKSDGCDFINCVVWEKGADFAEKYLHKGDKVGITGRIQTSVYDDKDGKTVHSVEIVVTNHYFCESKKKDDGFVDIPEGQAEALPFN